MRVLDLPSLVDLVNKSEWARRWITAQESARTDFLLIAGATDRQVAELLEVVKKSAIDKAILADLPVLETFETATEIAKDLLAKGIPLSYIQKNFHRLEWHVRQYRDYEEGRMAHER